MSVYNFLVSGPKFTNLTSSNRGGNVVDQANIYRTNNRNIPR